MPNSTGITKVIWVPDLGGSPARVNRKTGVMYLSRQDMEPLSKEVRFFIMLHEMGHVVLQSTDENKVDEWAFKQYVKRGYSLKQSVYALTKVLNDKNPEHAWRMYMALQRAQAYDYNVNGNLKVYKNGASAAI